MGYYYGYGIDWTYILVIIGAVISMIASSRVNSEFKKFSRVTSRSGLTGAQAAMELLHSQGIYDVSVQHIAGNLTDHFDPRNKTVSLSDPVYNSTSLAAIGVAAHECGHAMQHAKGYAPLAIRSALVPVANIGSTLSWPLIIIGLLIGGSPSTFFIKLGIIFFMGALLFQIVTLPVEFNASARALRLLQSTGLMAQDEVSGSRRVLKAAALTYVAAVAASILQLIRLLAIANRRR
ncbi:MAG: zinc metallopeptidase [Lachnospiraceae bacterium]|nr:zinc metallopeptidase [Lachnospiraceae bacterium]